MSPDAARAKPDRRDEALERLAAEIEEQVFGVLGPKVDPKLAEEIRARIRERTERELKADARALLDRFGRSVLREALGRVEASRRADERKAREVEREEAFPRFNRFFRLQHGLLFTSVILLILTGLPLKFPNVPALAGLIHLLGGIEASRLLHRIGATGLIVVAVVHTLYTVLHPEGRRDFLLLLPRPRDVRDLVDNLRYFLGRVADRPRFDRFSYIEKFDYWAVYWGCAVMIGSGALLWFHDFSLRHLPKFLLDIAKEAHSDEALLATLAIVIWHLYNVHLNPDVFPMSWTWWKGTLTRSEMEHHHPLELERILKEREERARPH